MTDAASTPRVAEDVYAGVPPPSAELFLIAADIFATTKGDPAAMKEHFRLMALWLSAREELIAVVRIRDWRHDMDSLEKLAAAMVWLDKVDCGMTKIGPHTDPKRFRRRHKR